MEHKRHDKSLGTGYPLDEYADPPDCPLSCSLCRPGATDPCEQTRARLLVHQAHVMQIASLWNVPMLTPQHTPGLDNACNSYKQSNVLCKILR